MTQPITVLKFGGSALRDENDLPKAVHEIYRHWRRGSQILAVVSAFGGTTDELIGRSKQYGEDPHPEALATLLHTGEATSAALLALALKRAGVPSKLLTPEQVGILTQGDLLDAEPVAADVERIRQELEHSIVIVSGFVGTNSNGDRTLLGRGGTDFTALYLARQLDARCILVKDVDAMYESNPSNGSEKPRRFASASYQTTAQVAGKLIQEKAIRFARDHKLEFEISALGSSSGTVIGDVQDQFSGNGTTDQEPLKVAILGCGTVGGGVYQRLTALPQHFEIVGVVNLDPDKAIASGIKAEQIERDAYQLIQKDCDVVVELIGGIEPARSLIKHAMELKRHVVTANKALLAEDGIELEELAKRSNAAFHYSASVGGSLPALESVSAVARRGEVRSVSGIINGTCNYICDQLSGDVDFSTALNTAQIEGYAEADPTLDLDGTDAAQKLILLARAAFGVDIPLGEIERVGIDGLDAEQVNAARAEGCVYRLIAKCQKTDAGIEAFVRPVKFPRDHVFALTTGTGNCLIVESGSGEVKYFHGRGAGRHATSEAVVADLFDVKKGIDQQLFDKQVRRIAA